MRFIKTLYSVTREIELDIPSEDNVIVRNIRSAHRCKNAKNRDHSVVVCSAV